ncbi:hypothetical protein Y032_0198g1639 [Ancylostoma ceylanicum]|uniref:TIL domain-containing protein n=1 Tax=Ancylostoma ceylanicum TaxID=53326 RepID=A0A016SP09_9BILA|nr:hypothetical protein Y032_0198g1639 [Ancylostoma ceylanicum]
MGIISCTELLTAPCTFAKKAVLFGSSLSTFPWHPTLCSSSPAGAVPDKMGPATVTWLFAPMLTATSALSLIAGDSNGGLMHGRAHEAQSGVQSPYEANSVGMLGMTFVGAPNQAAKPGMGPMSMNGIWSYALPTCGMNEAYTDCTSACQPKCGVNSTTCTKECGPPGCECLPGYFRNAENICVSHDQCTTNSNTSCGKNEEYTPCSGCESQCFGTTSRCSRECGPPKCQCRDNYFRHMNGSCVAKEHCSATTGSSKPLILPRPGLNGTIPTVPMNCAANEYYTNCTSSCEPRCNGTKDICDKACGPPGCQCLPGYVRADDNSCVLRKQCGGATTCGMNEEHVICSGCEDKCSGERSRCGRGCGPPKCQCAANFYRHVNGSCVAKEHCIASEAATSCANVLCAPKTECQMVYSSECLHAGHCLAVPQCIPQNLTNTCANVRCDSSRECKMVQHNCSSTPCNPMPHCLPPASGTTTPRFGINSSSTRTTPVPTDSQECEENEEFTECMPSCQMTCTGRRECSSTFAATMCTAGCVCKAGYRRNADGQCVKPRRCYLSPGCKAYEEWSSCANCENKCDGSTRSCSTCYSGCACIRGYSRSAMDRCIPTEDCP